MARSRRPDRSTGSNRLKKRVRIWRPEAQSTGYVAAADGFVCVTPRGRPASIVPLGGDEVEVAQRLNQVDMVRIDLRYEVALEDIASDWVIQNMRTGRVYDVRHVEDIEKHDRWIILKCQHGKQDLPNVKIEE